MKPKAISDGDKLVEKTVRFDIDRRPSGNVAMALCAAILQARIYVLENRGDGGAA